MHANNVDSPPLYVYKLPPKTTNILLTDRLIYALNNDENVVYIISSQLSECRLEGESEFNEDSLIGQFPIENETILHVYKQTDTSVVRLRKHRDDTKKEKLYELPKNVDDLNIQKPRIDTCVIITNTSVYKICIR